MADKESVDRGDNRMGAGIGEVEVEHEEEEDRHGRSSSNSNSQRDIQNYQRKLFFGQDAPGSNAQKTKKKANARRKQLAICASLVDKIPNLAGICR